jgi:hypothetical protein
MAMSLSFRFISENTKKKYISFSLKIGTRIFTLNVVHCQLINISREIAVKAYNFDKRNFNLHSEWVINSRRALCRSLKSKVQFCKLLQMLYITVQAEHNFLSLTHGCMSSNRLGDLHDFVL